MNPAKTEIVNLLKKELKLTKPELETPPDSNLGDYAFPCFQLSKQFKKNPIEIAMDLAKKIKPTKLIKEIKEIGPYLNFYINKQELANIVIKDILDKKQDYGKGKDKDEKIMIEYVSPNTNKSLHLGHVRNGLLGSAVANILEFNGYKVIRTCLNNDRGTGMAEAMLGYMMFHKGEEPDIKADHFVAQCYVDFKKSAKEKPELEKQAKELVLKWEQGDKETLKLWKKMRDWVLDGYRSTYDKLDISFDKEYYESDIYKQGKEIVEQGLKKGIFEKKEGAIIAPLKKCNLPDKVLIKSDGTSLYMTQDLFLAQLKEKEFNADRSIYVVASEQDNHFRQLFKILELLKYKGADKLYHLSYGIVNLPSGRMKSREGNVVDADDLVEEVTELAKTEIIKRHEDLKEDETEKRSDMIGMGALKFFMLKFDNITSFTFNPEESLSFEGETGPYCQYAHARICSILERYEKKVRNSSSFSLLTSPEEEKIILLLAKFPETIEESANAYKPHIIARYVLDLAQAFNEFYHACPILEEDDDKKLVRLNLILAVKQVIENSLKLLGIDSPKAM